MARIRSIKPEFFLHEDLADLSPLCRLLFIGLWTQADREGRLKDKPRRIKAAVLPYDDCDVDALLGELERIGVIIRYSVDEEGFIDIPSFLTHQKPHQREADSEIPPVPANFAKAMPEHNLGSASAPPKHNLGDVEPGGSGKGREGKERRARKARELSIEAVSIGQEIALLTGTEYPPASFDALETRLRDGDMTADDALLLVRWAAEDKFWGGEVKLSPSTLFRPKHYAELLAKAKAAANAPPPHDPDEPSYYRRLL